MVSQPPTPISKFFRNSLPISNLFVAPKNETTNSPINEYKVLHKCQRLYQRAFLLSLFNGILFVIYIFKTNFKPCLFILKTLKDNLQNFKFVNW